MSNNPPLGTLFPNGFTTLARFASIVNLSDEAFRLLTHYADYASVSQGFLLYASDDTVASALRWSTRKVQRNRKALEAAGFLTTKKQGQGRPMLKWINWDAISAAAHTAALTAGLHVQLPDQTKVSSLKQADTTEMSSAESHPMEGQSRVDTSSGELTGEVKQEKVNTLPKPSETHDNSDASMAPSPAEETPKQRHKRWCKEIPALITLYTELYEKEVGVPPDLNGLGAKMAGLLSQRLHHQSPAVLGQVLRTCFSTSDFALSHARLSPLKIFSAEVFNRFQALDKGNGSGMASSEECQPSEEAQPTTTRLWDSINEEWYEPH